MVVYQNDTLIAGTDTDFEGRYRIVDLDPGKYSIEVTLVGFKQTRFENIEIKSGEKKELNVVLEEGISLDRVEVLEYCVPLIEEKSRSRDMEMASDEIRRLPPGSVDALSSKVRAASSKGKNRKFDLTGAAGGVSAHSIDGIAYMTDSEMAGRNDATYGLLTAGERNDLDNWAYWKDLSKLDLGTEHQGKWGIYPNQRISVRVINYEKQLIADCAVKAVDKNGNIVWSTRTDNFGNAELWVGLYGEKHSNIAIWAEKDGISSKLISAKAMDEGVNTIWLERACSPIVQAEIMFVVDATGSMCDEIEYLKAEIGNVVNSVKRRQTDLRIKTGATFYRDIGDEYVVRTSALDEDLEKTTSFVKNQYCGGGGDTPEAVHTALESAIWDQNWDEEYGVRMVFLVLDAPAHQDKETIESLHKSIEKAAELGIKIIPIVGSGIDKAGEFLCRYMALATNGTYVFLTNDSGIGNDHLEPTVDDYEVEFLKDVLQRLIVKYTTDADCQPIDQNESNENGRELNVKIFPNPSTGLAMVELHEGKVHLEIYNSSGQLVKDFKALYEGRHSFDFNHYPAGTYAFKFSKGSKHVEKKWILVNP